MRRFAMLALSLSLVLVLTGSLQLVADDAKKDEAPKPAETPTKDEAAKPAEPKAKPAETKPAETKPAETKAAETKAAETKAAEAPLPTIPPEVEAKLEAARRAVAEAIVAARRRTRRDDHQSAPDPRHPHHRPASPMRGLKARTGSAPRSFCAWFTGQGKLEGITAQRDVRMVQPSDGLKTLYEQVPPS